MSKRKSDSVERGLEITMEVASSVWWASLLTWVVYSTTKSAVTRVKKRMAA